ncbi:hypothetical protein ACFQJD_14250 [Haloplanus sp. GCM10025708]|uniref:hypothetical protein n=1 Tax=Haloferacaceae TaxID=1644056 RepID=UPI00361FAFCC
MADYRGVFGAFPYAFRASDSVLFRSYVVVSALVAALVAALFGLALVVLVGRTAGTVGGSLTLSRAFYVLLALLVVAPVVAPTLFVARRHRRGEARDDAYDAALALSGYLFLASLYVGLVATVPEAQQTTPAGALAPAVRALYGLPAVAGAVPPLTCALVIYLVHRALR